MAASHRSRRSHPAARYRPARGVDLRRLDPRWLGAVLAVLVLGATVLTARVQTSAASTARTTQLKPGAGRWLVGHSTFVGYYRALVGGRWVKVYCVSPAKRTPTHIGLATVTRLPSVGAVVTRELAETLAAHGNAPSARQAEAVSQALNYEIGNRRAVAERGRSLGRSVQALAMRYVAEARRYRGGYQLGLHLSSSPLPGQSGRATVTLRGAGGGRAATVRLSHSGNVALPVAVRTDSAGRGSFTYRTTGGGDVRMRAAASGLPPVTLRTSSGAGSTQRMLSWSATTSAQASGHYRGRQAGFSERYECSSTCDGNPQATLTACAPAGTYPSTITYHVGGADHQIDFPAADSRSCRSWSTTLHDGLLVTASWRFRTPGGWTAPVPAPGSFRVDCPPAPPVAVAVSYDCRSATLTVTLGRQDSGSLIPLHNATTHPMVLVVAGARADRFTVAPGATDTPHSYPIDCGAAAVVAVRSGIQRDAGGYNYGQTTQITLP
jgi:hypothetical protein